MPELHYEYWSSATTFCVVSDVAALCDTLRCAQRFAISQRTSTLSLHPLPIPNQPTNYARLLCLRLILPSNRSTFDGFAIYNTAKGNVTNATSITVGDLNSLDTSGLYELCVRLPAFTLATTCSPFFPRRALSAVST